MNRITIICIGNELRCDDGAAIRVGRVLEALPLPEEVTVLYSAQISLDWVDAIGEADHLILLDATTTGAPPGSLVRFSIHDLLGQAVGVPSGHSLGLPQLLALARAVHPGRAESVEFLGIEAAFLEGFGTCLSAPVKAAIPQAVAKVLESLGLADPHLLAVALALAQAQADANPSIQEACAG